MPLLEESNLPILPVAKAVGRIADQLTNARGLTDMLNTSVAIGVDSVLSDAMQGMFPDSVAPAVRICYPIEALFVASNTGGGVYYRFTLSLYFIYYFGAPATMPPVSFSDLRDRHIAWNLEQLQNAGIAPNSAIGLPRSAFLDDKGKQFWMFPGDAPFWTIDHDTPFRYLDQSVAIPANSGYACSRVDIPIQVLKHATFNA